MDEYIFKVHRIPEEDRYGFEVTRNNKKSVYAEFDGGRYTIVQLIDVILSLEED